MSSSTSFLSSDGIRLRCAICITGSTLSSVSSVFAVYHFVVAPTTIRSSPFNGLVIAAIMLQGLQGVQRILTSSLILSNSISAELCNIFGVANTFIDVTTAILMVGFYYKLLALRIPLCSEITRWMNSPLLAHFAERYFFIVFSILWGTLIAVWGTLSATQEPTGALFASQLGWCQLEFHRSGHFTSVFVWGIAFPAVIEISFALASFVSLRCLGLSMERVTLRKYWPIYVRWCAIIVFNSIAYAVAAIGLANEQTVWGQVLEMCLWPLAGMVYAATFLFTEQLVRWFRHDDTDNGFSSSISALLATEVSGLPSAMIDAEGLEEDNVLISKSSSRPRRSTASVQVRTGYAPTK